MSAGVRRAVRRGQCSLSQACRRASARSSTGSTSQRVLSRSKAIARALSSTQEGYHLMAPFTLVIGNKNYSSWSLRAWLFLKHARLAFEEVVIALDTDTTHDEIEKYGPSGRLPVLRHGEVTVWDSLAIC